MKFSHQTDLQFQIITYICLTVHQPLLGNCDAVLSGGVGVDQRSFRSRIILNRCFVLCPGQILQIAHRAHVSIRLVSDIRTVVINFFHGIFADRQPRNIQSGTRHDLKYVAVIYFLTQYTIIIGDIVSHTIDDTEHLHIEGDLCVVGIALRAVHEHALVNLQAAGVAVVCKCRSRYIAGIAVCHGYRYVILTHQDRAISGRLLMDHVNACGQVSHSHSTAYAIGYNNLHLTVGQRSPIHLSASNGYTILLYGKGVFSVRQIGSRCITSDCHILGDLQAAWQLGVGVGNRYSLLQVVLADHCRAGFGIHAQLVSGRPCRTVCVCTLLRYGVSAERQAANLNLVISRNSQHSLINTEFAVSVLDILAIIIYDSHLVTTNLVSILQAFYNLLNDQLAQLLVLE